MQNDAKESHIYHSNTDMLVSNLQLQLPKLELETLQELAGCLDSTIRVTGLSRPRQTDRQTDTQPERHGHDHSLTSMLACSPSLSLSFSLSLSLLVALALALPVSLHPLAHALLDSFALTPNSGERLKS